MNYFKTILLIFVLFTPSALLWANAKPTTLYIIAHKGDFNLKNEQNIENYYLLKNKVNTEGKRVIPINLPSNHPLRMKFSIAVFNRSPAQLSEYWDRMSFRGIRPPIIQQSEQAVVVFVSRIKGAIGYVSQKPDNHNIDVLGEVSL